MSGYFIQLADQAQEGVTGGVQVPRAPAGVMTPSLGD